MKSDRETESSAAATRTRSPRNATAQEWVESAQVRMLRDHLDGAGACFVSRAPGRLDVLGGLSDRFGVWSLFAPTKECVHVAMRPRSDGRIFITDLTSPSASAHGPAVLESAALLNGTGPRVLSLERTGLFEHDSYGVVRGVLGTLAEAVRTRLVDGLGGGFSFVIHAGGRALACLARNTALTAATLRVLTGLVATPVDAATLRTLAHDVQREWYGVLSGPGDMACAWSGCANELMQLRGGAEPVHIALPPGVAVVGLSSGAGRADAGEKWNYVQTAAEMGHTIVNRIVDAEGGAPDAWDSSLAQLGVDPYADRFRYRIPTRIRGCEFKKQFATATECASPIHDETTYKVRSRTEHHIYEQDRCQQFARLVREVGDSPGEEHLRQMGELMYSAHWSYSQRCGLGSIGAESLVKSIRTLGPSSGIYGARVSGRGCGGIVTVLMADRNDARSALEEVTAQYTARTGNEVTVLRGSIDGAGVDGFREL